MPRKLEPNGECTRRRANRKTSDQDREAVDEGGPAVETEREDAEELPDRQPE